MNNKNNVNNDDLFKRGNGKSKILRPRSFRYWQNSVGRLNVFTDSHLSAGQPVYGRIPKSIRKKVEKALKKLLSSTSHTAKKPYAEVKKEEFRPFTYSQESEMMRVIAGGLVV